MGDNYEPTETGTEGIQAQAMLHWFKASVTNTNNVVPRMPRTERGIPTMRILPETVLIYQERGTKTMCKYIQEGYRYAVWTNPFSSNGTNIGQEGDIRQPICLTGLSAITRRKTCKRVAVT